MSGELPKTADAVVVGGGIVGVAVARQLALDGLQPVLLESGAFGGAVSGASLACLGTHMHDIDELPVLVETCAMWQDLADQLENPFEYNRCGQLRFILRKEDVAVAEHWVARERAFGLPPELLSPQEVQDIEPMLTGPIFGASYSPGDATVNPFLAVRELLADGRRHGVTAFPSTPAMRLLDDGNAITGIQTPRGDISAPHVVLAAGPWSGRLAASVGIQVPVNARQAQCLASTRQQPALRTVIGACESSGGVESGYTQIQQAKSGQILFNTVVAPDATQPDSKDHINEVPLRFVRDSIRTLSLLFPGLSDIQLLRSWVRFEAVSPDDRFLTGELGLPGLLIAAGDNGSGFCRAPFMARLISQLIRGMDPGPLARLYEPQRFGELPS
ncbi:MAG TPA: FAD-binding oxidoreductase [Burkholderiaceae bacterium]|nr:FAD-binding oxidoreductase [Burkholderiaceae bacterium]